MTIKLRPETEEWLQWMPITSIPLVHIGPSEQIRSSASGCLVTFRQRRFIFATAHAATRGTSGWALDIAGAKGGGTAIFTPSHWVYAGEFTRGADEPFRETDFCFAEIPSDISPVYRHETPRGITDEQPCQVFDTDLTCPPRSDEIYAFAGRVRSEFHQGVNALVSDMVVYPGLSFLRQENEMLIFKLPVEHPGHEAFRGCSGAPIIGKDRRPVALVCSGDPAEGTIAGISLARQRPMLDFWCSST